MVNTATRVRTPAPATALQCRALPWDGSSEGEVALAWHRLFTGIPAVPVSHHPEWTALECRARAVKPWRVLVISRDDEPVGIIPLRKRTPWTAEVIDDFCGDQSPVLIDPRYEQDVWACVAAWLKGRSGIRSVILGRHIDPDRLPRFREATAPHGVIPRIDTVMETVAITLPDDWESYLAQLGSRTRTELRRLERQLIRDFPQASLEIITDPIRGDAMLDELMKLHRRRWGDTLCGSHFANPVKALYYREVFRWALQRQWGAIAALQIDGAVIAAGTFFHIPGQKHVECHMLACDRTASLPKRFSPGILLFMHIARWAIAHQVRVMGMGFGKSEYKLLLGGQVIDRWELSLARSAFDARFTRLAYAACHYLHRLPACLRYLWRRVANRHRTQRADALGTTGA